MFSLCRARILCRVLFSTHAAKNSLPCGAARHCTVARQLQFSGSAVKTGFFSFPEDVPPPSVKTEWAKQAQSAKQEPPQPASNTNYLKSAQGNISLVFSISQIHCHPVSHVIDL
jgi:hypothetical protein